MVFVKRLACLVGGFDCLNEIVARKVDSGFKLETKRNGAGAQAFYGEKHLNKRNPPATYAMKYA